jgi:DNA polymerase III delta subunit
MKIKKKIITELFAKYDGKIDALDNGISELSLFSQKVTNADAVNEIVDAIDKMNELKKIYYEVANDLEKLIED